MSSRVPLLSLLMVLLSTALVSTFQIPSSMDYGYGNILQEKVCAVVTDELRATQTQVEMLQNENEILRRALETITEQESRLRQLLDIKNDHVEDEASTVANTTEGRSLQETIRDQLQEYNITKNWWSLRNNLVAEICSMDKLCSQLLQISEFDRAPLYRIGYNGMTELATLLVSSGHAESIYDSDGENMLYGAAESGHAQLVAMLLDHGAAVDPCNNQWRSTPLIRATHYNQTEAVKVLVERGADVNFSDKYGITSLHFAAQNGDVELVQYLVEAGANTGAVDQNGQTPLDMTQSKGHTAVADYLSQVSL